MTTPIVTEVSAESVGLDPEDSAGSRFFLCQWPDRSGYYEIRPDGTICCTVFHQSETFAGHASAQQWLHDHLQ